MVRAIAVCLEGRDRTRWARCKAVKDAAWASMGGAEVHLSPTLDPPTSTGNQQRALADQRLRSGNIEGAVAAHVRALAIEPAHQEQARRLNIALRDLGRTEQAQPLSFALKRASEESYQQDVQRLRLTPYVDFPQHVHLETLAKCNARCTFCPSPVLERSGARLDDAVIQKVITDLQDIPSDLRFQLSPFKVNEPFLDVRLFDILDLVEAQLPNASIALTSNGSPITTKKLARLGDYSNIKTLYISFNDHRQIEYEAVMGLSYERTIARLDALHSALTQSALKVRVVVSRVGDGSPDDDSFRIWVVRRWPAFDVIVMRRGDWLGQVDTPISSVPDVGCMRWFELSITATGTVAHCCMDGQAAWPLGDVTQSHVLEIYNQPDFRQLRLNAMSRREAEPCNTCTFM